MLYEPGDILGFSGRSFVSDLINIATYGIPRWSLSHVGIVAMYQGRRLLFEATTLDDEPCAIMGQKIHGVQSHAIDNRVRNYDGRAWHYPLSERLGDDQSQALSDFLIMLLGTSYDSIGAFRSGGEGFSFIESILRPANLQSIFCSELTAAAHAKIGLFKTLNVSRYNPNRFVRTELVERIIQRPRRLK